MIKFRLKRKETQRLLEDGMVISGDYLFIDNYDIIQVYELVKEEHEICLDCTLEEDEGDE